MDHRIAFAGASGTGKTTLAKRVAAQLDSSSRPPYAFCPVGSRDTAKEMGFDSPYDVDAAGKRAEFQRLLFERKHRWENERFEFVTDRTHSDNAAYSMIHGCWTGAMIESYTRANARYTHIFLCPMTSYWNLGEDPMRVSERAYHERFEERLIESLLRTVFVAPITIVTPSNLDERVDLVLRLLR
jgi:nicotinamide riboside kinase